jgi:hypothetical protein
MRMMAQQTFGGDIIISVDLIRSRLNVESHELAIVPRPKLGTDITLIDGLSPLGNTRSGEEETAGDAPCNRLPVTAASSCLPAPWSRGGLHQAAALLLHRHMPAGPEPLLKAIAPDRADRVVGVEGRFPWYGLADRWARERMPLVLGQALSRNAIHGGNATHDRGDAQHMAVLRRGGMLPPTSVSPAARRATRDLLRRRKQLRRQRAALRPHSHTTKRPYNLLEMEKNIADQANRAGVADRKRLSSCSAPILRATRSLARFGSSLDGAGHDTVDVGGPASQPGTHGRTGPVQPPLGVGWDEGPARSRGRRGSPHQRPVPSSPRRRSSLHTGVGQ